MLLATSKYSYHVGEEAVLAKYSSCVTSNANGPDHRRKKERGERKKMVGSFRIRKGIRHTIAFMAAGWQHDTTRSLNNATRMTHCIFYLSLLWLLARTLTNTYVPFENENSTHTHRPRTLPGARDHQLLLIGRISLSVRATCKTRKVTYKYKVIQKVATLLVFLLLYATPFHTVHHWKRLLSRLIYINESYSPTNDFAFFAFFTHFACGTLCFLCKSTRNLSPTCL